MAFPIMNANVLSATILSNQQAGGDTPMFELVTGTFGYAIAEVPGVVDVSGMEFGIAKFAGADTTIAVSMASAASTIVMRMCDLGTTGSAPASTNYLFGADTSFTATTAANTGAVSDFSNSVDAGWTVGAMKSGAGTSATDLDADDIVGMQALANISGAAGIGVVHVTMAYVYGKPGAIN